MSKTSKTPNTPLTAIRNEAESLEVKVDNLSSLVSTLIETVTKLTHEQAPTTTESPVGFATVKTLADMYDVSRPTMEAFLLRNNLQARKFGTRSFRYSIEEVERVAKQGGFEYRQL